MKKFFIGLGILALIIIVLVLVGGGFAFMQANKYAPSVEAFVDAFYESYNQQDADYIYNELSDVKFRDTSKFVHFEKFIKWTYEKLGPVKSRKKGAWKIFTGPGGTIFSVEYKVKHEKAESVDSFSLKRDNNSWLLYGYHVDSPDLF